MKRPVSTSSGPGGLADEALRAPSSLRGLLQDRELEEIERAWPDGMTSRQIVDVFETRGIRFSEATLRKYVQLGLLPRSVRVGRTTLGAGHPIAVQSMTATKTQDIEATVRQVQQLESAGAP